MDKNDVIKFRHSSKNHSDAEGTWFYVEYSDNNWKTHSGFGPLPEKVCNAIIGEKQHG